MITFLTLELRIGLRIAADLRAVVKIFTDDFHFQVKGPAMLIKVPPGEANKLSPLIYIKVCGPIQSAGSLIFMPHYPPVRQLKVSLLNGA